MIVENCGWSEDRGLYNDKYFIDEDRTNYEIHYSDGYISKQVRAFESITADWNNDGDSYTEFVAGFENRYGGTDNWTPESLVSEIIDGNITVDGIVKMN